MLAEIVEGFVVLFFFDVCQFMNHNQKEKGHFSALKAMVD
jgi:hypothetical protein